MIFGKESQKKSAFDYPLTIVHLFSTRILQIFCDKVHLQFSHLSHGPKHSLLRLVPIATFKAGLMAPTY